MESSIAKFLWRQPACERLPTNVGRALLGSKLSKSAGCCKTRLRAPGATARREGACFGVSLRHRGAPCLRRLSARPGGAPARGRGACLAVSRRHAGAVVAPSPRRPGAGGGGVGAVFNPTAPTNPKYGVGSVEGAFPRHRGVMAARWFPSPVVGVRSPAGPLCRSARVCVAQLGAFFAKGLL